MIGYIVRIVDDTSKDQHALISTTRRRHWETQRAPPITNVRTAEKPWTNEWEIIPVHMFGRHCLYRRLDPCILSTPTIIANGAKNMHIEVPGCRVRMIDSINILPSALSDLPAGSDTYFIWGRISMKRNITIRKRKLEDSLPITWIPSSKWFQITVQLQKGLSCGIGCYDYVGSPGFFETKRQNTRDKEN
jgi:hypothetical protein